MAARREPDGVRETSMDAESPNRCRAHDAQDDLIKGADRLPAGSHDNPERDLLIATAEKCVHWPRGSGCNQLDAHRIKRLSGRAIQRSA